MCMSPKTPQLAATEAVAPLEPPKPMEVPGAGRRPKAATGLSQLRINTSAPQNGLTSGSK